MVPVYFEKWPIVQRDVRVHRLQFIGHMPDVQKKGNIEGPRSWFHDVLAVWAVYTGTRPGVPPAIRVGKGVAGTPGVCSQVFCHPN